MKFPSDCLYTKEHEWVRVQEGVAIIGITEHAQQELGDVVFVELPKVGDTFDTHEPFANVESVKAVSEVFCPLAGEVLEVNAALSESPQLANEDPYGGGWFIKLKITDSGQLKNLLNHEEYAKFVAEEPAE
ncbi:MAG: glycine cleavage system protein GcvH [Acidobacteria bacterium]|nr:glycine cleavage system protein GcvH [Acidobacteriota bacterium]MCI0625939.1 glycine cleavage system protein GcvH [Acidobacteriota bacterium]MCI0719837.1 glycine cleavage system protein GcvH [Acidobacteriota bacterium]